MSNQLKLSAGNKRVIVQEIVQEKSKGGIILPDRGNDYCRAKVLTNAPGGRMFSKNDIVHFERIGAIKFEFNGEQYASVHEDSIFAIELGN